MALGTSPSLVRAAQVIAVSGILCLCPPGWGEERPRLQAVHRGAHAISIDGRLDEPGWAQAAYTRHFIERIPVPMAEPAAPTEVHVLYDEEALYVGVRCHLIAGVESEPRALELTFDSFRLYQDDAVTVKIDPRRDSRTTLGFGINPAGALIDYIALDNGRTFRREYDMLWEAEAFVGEGFWSAEFRIPVSALGLSDLEGERTIGFNVTRDHNDRLATYDWSHLPPEFGPVAALYYGSLSGLQGMGGGVPLMLLPYALGGYRDREGLSPFEGKLGGELRMNVADNVFVEASILTDFAQVDLDDPVVNLNRFPLFLPERRPFFLSGLEIFDVGESGVAQLFFSRRIGLDDAARILPVLGGLKTYGRRGPVEFGLLETVTGAGQADEASNAAVARLRYNLTDTSHLGAIFTHRGLVSGPGREGLFGAPNLGFGLDGAVRFQDRIELSGFWASTLDEAIETSRVGHAAQAALQFRGYEVQPVVSVLVVTDDFDPAIGFVRRAGAARSRAELPWIHRTSDYGLASLRAAALAELTTSEDFRDVLEQRFHLDGVVRWRNGFQAELRAEMISDVVQTEFELFPDVSIAPGLYQGFNVRAALRSPEGRNPSLALIYNGGDYFFGGAIHALRLEGTLNLGSHLRWFGATDLAFMDLPHHPALSTFTLSTGAVLAIDNRLSFETNFQMNDVADRAIALLRVRWRYLPGSDLFFVYREDLDLLEPGQGERSLTLKLTYRFETVL